MYDVRTVQINQLSVEKYNSYNYSNKNIKLVSCQLYFSCFDYDYMTGF